MIILLEKILLVLLMINSMFKTLNSYWNFDQTLFFCFLYTIHIFVTFLFFVLYLFLFLVLLKYIKKQILLDIENGIFRIKEFLKIKSKNKL